MTIEIARWQFSVADYARMLETGILSEDDQVELIEGDVRPMSPIGPLHAAIVKRLNTFLNAALGGSALVSVQDPIRLSDYTEPEPDLAVVRARADFYATGHPQAEDVLLLIEVADTSLDYDRDEKVPRYARAMVPEVWIVDVHGETVEQYTNPRTGIYRTIHLLKSGDTLDCVTLPQVRIRLDFILGNE
ncbi:MAG: Uma2 family endonuclease [Roseiflexaceae bacterium]|nr:Uma2 family endonuclease [Roseiflexaceae bacterium]